MIPTVKIYDNDKNIVYKDTDGILGPKGEKYQLSELKNYWNSNALRGDDPILDEYRSFNEWMDGLALEEDASVHVRTWRVYFDDGNRKLLEAPSILIVLQYLESQGYDVGEIYKVEEAN